MFVLLNPVCTLLSEMLHVYMSEVRVAANDDEDGHHHFRPHLASLSDNDTQTRVIGSIECAICTAMLGN